MSPFDPLLLSHNEAQLDFILENYAEDNPDGGLTVTRPGQVDPDKASIDASVAWENILIGRGLEEHREKDAYVPNDAVRAALARRGGRIVR